MIRLFSSNRSEEKQEELAPQSSVPEEQKAASESASEYNLLVSEYSDALVSLEKIPHYFKKMAQSHQQIRADRDELLEKNTFLNGECQRFKENVLKHENELIRAREKEHTLKLQLEQETRNLKTMQEYRINSEADIREYKNRILEAESKLEKLSPLAKSLAQEKDVLQSSLDRMITEKTALEKLNSEFDSKLQESRGDVTKLESKSEYLQRAKSELEQKLQLAREELVNKETVLNSGEHKIAHADEKINKLNSEIDALRKENEHIVRAREESNRALNNELDAARNRARTMEGILEESRTRARVDSQRTAEVRKENVQLALDMSQKDVLIKSLNEQLSESAARARIAGELQSEMDNRHNELIEKNKSLHEELNAFREEHSTLVAQKESAEKTIEALQKDFDATTTMFEQRLRNLEGENADLRKQIQSGDGPDSPDGGDNKGKKGKEDDKVVRLKT